MKQTVGIAVGSQLLFEIQTTPADLYESIGQSNKNILEGTDDA